MELGLTGLMIPAPQGTGARMADGSVSKHMGVIDHLSFALGTATFGTKFFVGSGSKFNILLGNSFIYPEKLVLDFEKLCIRRRIGDQAVEKIPPSVDGQREKPRWEKLWHRCEAPAPCIPAVCTRQHQTLPAWFKTAVGLL